ncbi:unnamed protein product [Urochloa decumbens]|uniref:BED-type domain-containing protein n=1 Tax=Urochloa decumbens TaxID=240449 RepID=A0ABC9H075_9POAL
MAEASAEGQNQIPRELTVARRLRPRSSVWEHFTHFTTVDGKSKAECKRCRRVLVAASKNGTSSLLRHVENCKGLGGNGTDGLDQLITDAAWDLPPLPWDPPLPLSCDLPSPLPCTDLPLPFPCDSLPSLPCTDPPPSFPCDPPPLLPCTDPPRRFPGAAPQQDDELPDREHDLGEEARKHLAQLIALHGYDPLLIEDDCFRRFVGSLNPEFKLPSRFAVEEMCDDIFDEARKDLLSRLSCFHGKISLAVSTTKTVHGEVLYTACHFIDDEWNLHKMVLDAYLVAPIPIFYGPLLGVPEVTPKSNFSDRAGNDILHGVLQHGILERLFIMVWAIKKSDEMKRYVKQLISVDLTYFLDTALHSIAGPSIILNPNFTTDMYEKVHGLGLTRENRRQQFSHIGLDHLQAHDNHWYSCYCSLELLRKHGSCTIAGKDCSQLMEVLCKIWGPTYRALQRISTSRYPTSNECLVVLFKLREILQSEVERTDGNNSISYNGSGIFINDDDVADVLREAKDTLDKIIQDTYLVWSVPLVLDPRYKLTYIKFIFSRAFGSGGARYISEVTRKMKKLYADYVEYDGGISGADSDGVTETAGSSADPLGQAWGEHCRSGDGMADVGSDLDAEEELYRSLEGLVIGSSDPLGQAWDKHCRSRGRGGRTDARGYLDAEKELDRYLEDPHETATEGFDILNWWRVNSWRYPTVARMAKDALAMPTSSNLSPEQMAHVSSIVRGYSKKKYRQAKYEP